MRLHLASASSARGENLQSTAGELNLFMFVELNGNEKMLYNLSVILQNRINIYCVHDVNLLNTSGRGNGDTELRDFRQ